jgi:hypothetical protein
MAYIFPYIGNVIIPTDELIFFRGVAQPPARLSWFSSRSEVFFVFFWQMYRALEFMDVNGVESRKMTVGVGASSIVATKNKRESWNYLCGLSD